MTERRETGRKTLSVNQDIEMDWEADGERIAKWLASAGVCSRRDAERLINDGKVTVNGEVLTSPAFKVMGTEEISVDGKRVAQPEKTRLWRYHKPRGLVTTNFDPEGRDTVFDKLPASLPRVLTVGRLDLNTEGLLLLTNDGELARALELPTSGLKRQYRARAYGHVTQAELDTLRDGLVYEGVEYRSIVARLDRVTGDNSWIDMTLVEGKKREARRALESLGLRVNRLIRVTYGPFELGELPEGAVVEVSAAELLAEIGNLVPRKRRPDPGRMPKHMDAPAPRRRVKGERKMMGRIDSPIETDLDAPRRRPGGNTGPKSAQRGGRPGGGKAGGKPVEGFAARADKRREAEGRREVDSEGRSDGPRGAGSRTAGPRVMAGRGARAGDDRPRGDRAFGDRPRGDGPEGGRRNEGRPQGGRPDRSGRAERSGPRGGEGWKDRARDDRPPRSGGDRGRGGQETGRSRWSPERDGGDGDAGGFNERPLRHERPARSAGPRSGAPRSDRFESGEGRSDGGRSSARFSGKPGKPSERSGGGGYGKGKPTGGRPSGGRPSEGRPSGGRPQGGGPRGGKPGGSGGAGGSRGPRRKD